jgi:uncharacterized delta-60 repeat protein
VVTNYRASYDHGNHLLLQPDGKIVLSGFVTEGAVNTGATYDFAVVRYNGDGSLDSTFGNGGIATADFAGSGDRVYWSVLQPDGKIVVAGVAFSQATGSDFALARYNTNGTLDLTFNGTGKVTTNFAGNFEDFGRSMALAPDGKLVVAGWARNNSIYTGRADYAVARYNRTAPSTPRSTAPAMDGRHQWRGRRAITPAALRCSRTGRSSSPARALCFASPVARMSISACCG